MGLTRRLVRLAARRPRCYVVEAPGGAAVRRAVEATLDTRGWQPSDSPAHADALVVAGTVPSDLSDAADLVWAQVPGPRVRVDVATVHEVGPALDLLPRVLSDPARTDEAAARPRPDHDDDHEHDEMAPSGISLAKGADDRDGLEMDALVHPWGPLLHRWPGGLELRLVLHGDVVAAADARWWGDVDQGLSAAVDAWDAVATTLALVGDERGARAARRLREVGGVRGVGDVGGVGDVEDPAARCTGGQVLRHVRRLRTLGALPAVVASSLLDQVKGTATGRLDPADLVMGHEVAEARLLVASHAPRLHRAPAGSTAPGGAGPVGGGCRG